MRKNQHGGRTRGRLIKRVLLLTSIVAFGASSPASAQISGTWTNMGLTPDFSDPYNWSSFPNVPGGGGEVILNGPYRSQLNISLSQNVELSRIANVGSLGMRISGGTGSITMVGP